MIPFFALFFTAFANGSAFAAVAPVINAPVDGSIIPKGPSDVICFVSADMQATSVAIKYKFTPTGGGATTTDTFMTNIGGPYWKQNMGKYQVPGTLVIDITDSFGATKRSTVTIQ